MRSFTRSFVVLLAAVLAVTTVACGDGLSSLSISPSSLTVNISGSLTVTPTVVLVGNTVNVSWTGGSAVRVDACNNMQCVVIATSGSSVQHTPATRGEWKYVLYGVIATPDMFVRVAEQSVLVN